MKYAIVESGGKQYKAVEGETIEVDRLALEIGAKLDLERVLLVADGENITVGAPEVAGVKVKATVVEHFKGPKIIVFKYHPKKRYRLKKGHRQQHTRLMIDKIGKATVKKAAKAAEVPAEEKKAEAKAKKPAAKKTETATKKPAAKKTAKAAEEKAPKKTTAAKKSPAKKPAKTTKKEE